MKGINVKLTEEQCIEIGNKLDIILGMYKTRKYTLAQIAEMYKMPVTEVSKITQKEGNYWHTIDRTGEWMKKAVTFLSEYQYLLKYDIK